MIRTWRRGPAACPLLPASGSTFMSIGIECGRPLRPGAGEQAARLRAWEYEGGALDDATDSGIGARAPALRAARA